MTLSLNRLFLADLSIFFL